MAYTHALTPSFNIENAFKGFQSSRCFAATLRRGPGPSSNRIQAQKAAAIIAVKPSGKCPYEGVFRFMLKNEDETPFEEDVRCKKIEVAQMRLEMPSHFLKKSIEKAPHRNFTGVLEAFCLQTGDPALFAQVLSEHFDIVEIAKACEKDGAATLSFLTNTKYYQVPKLPLEAIQAMRTAEVEWPMLCEELIVHPWQLWYVRDKGADAVILKPSVLRDVEITYMTQNCTRIGLTAVVEVRDEDEMDRMIEIPGIKVIYINNGNAETFEVIENTKKLLEDERGDKIRQKDIIVVLESGLFTDKDVDYIQEAAGMNDVVLESGLFTDKDVDYIQEAAGMNDILVGKIKDFALTT